MSTQHIEEADVLSNRICIMSHGRIIVLDKPDNIKRNFGVGYNIFIEPKHDSNLNQEDLQSIRKSIRNLITSGKFVSQKASESKDSVDRKMIF